MIDVRGLCKSFGEIHAVRDLHFTAERGRITSLIGPNGAGKSTVFSLISGAVHPDMGQVILDGKDITGLAPHVLARLGIARSFQITNLFFGLSTFENVRLACQALQPRYRYLTRTEALLPPSFRAARLIEQFELAEHAKMPAGDLSHGDQRRLEIAVCMASEPRVLLLDEPSQGMSPAETAAIDALIRSLAGTVTILLVEHDIDLVMGTSDHIIVLHQGGKLFEGPPAAVRESAVVREAYLGRDYGAA